ncbi:syndetin isoform X4 [Macrotis lagotis]|uniref:syndetin isoform X4 n=1 Tax=Macrotis lagotis TaxID=92651 RepID=UPI003D69B0EF
MQKIKSLMARQGLKSPQDGVGELSPIENLRLPSKEELRELREQPIDPQAQQEIINSIEDVYFSTDSFDIVKYEMEKLPPILNLQDLEAYRDKLKQQQAAMRKLRPREVKWKIWALQLITSRVSKKVADLILEKQPAYVKELERVTSLQTGLQLATVMCTNGRRHLNIAKEGFTQASLGLLANQRKRQLLVGLLKSLRTIKTLQRTDVRLSEMLEEEDYPGAIQLCLECQQAASTFRHYSCISELDSKLQDTLEQIEEQLDVALSKICKNFDVAHYTKVQQAYRLLGKTQTAMDQLHMHFTQAIHNTVFQVVLGYVELCAGNTDTKFQKLQYKDLCTHVTTDSYIPCLADLCKALWEVMLSYYRTMEWHEAHDNEDTTRVAEGSGTADSEESNFDRNYVKKKLEHGLSRIWQDVQLKVKTYLFGTDMSTFKYDDFIFVLDIISRLMQVGEEFCGSKSEVLQESIRKQSINYFKNYHRTRLDELRMFLENETWELCPVKSSFSILQLHYESDEPEKSAYQDYDSDSDVPEELKRDYVDEQTGDIPVKSVSRETLRSRKKSDYSLNKVNAPILTNTTLNVIRLVGKYMQMMSMLKPIAFDVVHFLSQLFDYYLYAIYTFFGRNDSLESTGLGLSSSRLRTTLNRIQESLIDLEVCIDPTGSLTAGEERKEKVPSPHLSHLVVLTSGDTLYGLAERVVATESLVFLAEQFEFLQPHLDAVMPAVKKPFLQQFYSQTVSTASELRKPIYWIVAGKAIDYEQMLLMMASVKWDVKEIMSQHNVYVDTLLKEFEQFNRRLTEVSRRVRIPLPVSNILWEHCIRLANRTIVEGYANVKKCSNEGRALMQLDFQQFLMKLEKLTDIRPIPDKEFVETYIKAYYLTENDMERWIKEHREYSSKQLTNLVNVCLGSHINKKARQKLLAAIDDIDRPKR